MFTNVCDSLALIWFGLLDGSDLSGYLTDKLLVNPGNFDCHLIVGDLNTSGCFLFDRLAKPEAHIELVVAGTHAVADTLDLELFLEAFGDALDSIVE